MSLYRDLDHAAIDREYDTDAAVPTVADYQAQFLEESERVRREVPCELDIAYGEDEAERLDVFRPASAGAPIQLFIHGGYWRGGRRLARAFPAESFCAAGALWIALGYPLAPRVSLDQIVKSVRDGIAWVWRNAEGLGGDPSRLYISGNSAGGHLTGMAAATDWRGDYGIDAPVIAGACAISGLFDLEPMRHFQAQEWLKLDEDAMRRNSPILHPPVTPCPMIVAVGGDETAEFRRQSAAYFEAWQGWGHPGSLLIPEGLHHYSIIGALNDPEGPLQQTMLAQMGLAAP